jgi:hypothetical protein
MIRAFCCSQRPRNTRMEVRRVEPYDAWLSPEAEGALGTLAPTAVCPMSRGERGWLGTFVRDILEEELHAARNPEKDDMD